MKKLTLLVTLSFLLIAIPSFGQDLVGTWCVYMSEAVSAQGQYCTPDADGSFGEAPPEEIVITDQDDFIYGTLFRGYVDHGGGECGYFSGVLDGKTISITHWDSVTRGTFKQKGNNPPEIYFINNAFPPQTRTKKVLEALNEAEDGYSVPQLQQQLNLSKSKIDKVLKLLSLESPAPVTKQGAKWYATAINYQIDTQKIAEIIKIRRQEQAQMQQYMENTQCLMAFLANALDDPHPQICGKCSVCLERDLLPTNYSTKTVNNAILYLRDSDRQIDPRKKWVSQALSTYEFSGNIKPELRAETGKALSLWGDAGWGKLVIQGKYEDNYFDDSLVQGTVDMILRWQPQPTPTWITYVPSLTRPNLVSNFARRLADKLNLSFKIAIIKIRQNRPQKQMNNSYQQTHNLDGAFEIDISQIEPGTVFLVDDIVDSRWTFTVIAALLRRAGSGRVFPVALTLNSLSS